MSYQYETLTKLDQHVSEMMTTAGKKFQNFGWFRFLISMQNVNMVANGKRNSRLNPGVYARGSKISHAGKWKEPVTDSQTLEKDTLKNLSRCRAHSDGSEIRKKISP